MFIFAIDRLATKKAKPCGQFYISKEETSNFIKAVHVSDLPGIGYSLHAKLSAILVRVEYYDDIFVNLNLFL